MAMAVIFLVGASSVSPPSSCLESFFLSFPLSPRRHRQLISSSKRPCFRFTNGCSTFLGSHLPLGGAAFPRTFRTSWKKRNSPFDIPEDQRAASLGTLPHIFVQAVLWILAVIYAFWLFLLPYAPGDPVWAIKPYTISMLLDLSVNFFYILPAANAAGFHFIEAPVIHPTIEALFNFVIGWTVMFAPLLFTDRKRENYKGSLEVLWILQMFLTNTVLIPYMALRHNGASTKRFPYSSQKIKLDMSGVRTVLITGASALGLIGGIVGLTSLLWFLIGRPDEGFGGFSDRWTFFLEYLDNDRPGYAFIWDICLYSAFQPWLIGDNLSNVEADRLKLVKSLRFVPYVGLIAYLWGLARD